MFRHNFVLFSLISSFAVAGHLFVHRWTRGRSLALHLTHIVSLILYIMIKCEVWVVEFYTACLPYDGLSLRVVTVVAQVLIKV